VSAHALKQAARDGEEEGGGEGHDLVCGVDRQLCLRSVGHTQVTVALTRAALWQADKYRGCWGCTCGGNTPGWATQEVG
jgi:hypothetical protein